MKINQSGAGLRICQRLPMADRLGWAAALWACLLPLCQPSVCAQDARILEIENVVQTAPKGGSAWTKAVPQQSLAVGDRIRTRQRSRATVALTGLFTLRIDQFTTIEVTPALVDARKPTLALNNGVTFIFSRDKQGAIDVKMPAVNAGLRGTQLLARVLPGGKSFVQVLEGRVELSNEKGRLDLAPGEAGEALPGQAPRRTAVIDANNILQWALYYPAVVDPGDLGNSASLPAASLAAYRRGDLLGAVAALPEQAPATDAGRLYHAASLLAVGRVDESRQWMGAVPANHPGRRAIERMIAAVRRTSGEADWPPAAIATASEALAESYYQQAWARLGAAKAAALRATELAPRNGFAWTRLAELEFSAGHTREAREAIASGLAFCPDNARAHALQGFILSAENRIGEARTAFERAVRLDGGLGNGWLGLGLTKIKQGRLAEGRADLQTAATVEPTVSIFHSYLGKAMSQDGLHDEAAKDLALAAALDPNDPTPPLYAAIEYQQRNRPNPAIDALGQSIRLNDNRRIYRSGFLLDQDRAVRSANLARIYQNAGMREVAVREATRAVESDYANASAHLFLANAFDLMRDPDRVRLRYETPWFNELLMANLLSPVGGGALSQFVTQQEYSKLLEADGIGGSINSEYHSTSETRTSASLFGTQGNISYGLDAYYRNDDGDRYNNALDLQELYGQFKWQATPDDIAYFLGKWASQQQGDLFETFDHQPLEPEVSFEENQEPGLLLGGWNHRWAPGSNTLFLLGRLAVTQDSTNPLSRQLLIQRDTSGMRPGFIVTDAMGDEVFADSSLIGSVGVRPDQSLTFSPALQQAIFPYLGSGQLARTLGSPINTETFDFVTRRRIEILNAELQHILQGERNTLLLGGRWQEGSIETDVRMNVMRPTFAGGFASPAADQHVDSDFRRTGLYVYDYWKVVPTLTLIAGFTWDAMDHPANFRNPPVSANQREEDDLAGKIGFTWTPRDWITLRGMAAEGIGGVTFDESVRLEPTQLAGFNQAYRTVLSESLAGSVEAPDYRILGLSAEGRLAARTWWGLSAGTIRQEVDRTVGVFTGYDSNAFSAGGIFPPSPVYFPDGTRQRLDYEEQTLSLTVNQLIGDEFALGGGYRVTRSELNTSFIDLASQPGMNLSDEATLHEISLYGDWNSPKGYFARLEANWFQQDLTNDPSLARTRSGDEFIQFNAWVGYRFNRNLCELRAGVLNLGGSDYQLSPLSPHAELTRDRTFFLGCRLSF